MALRLIHTQVFDRLASEIILLNDDGLRVRYPSCVNESASAIDRYLSAMHELNRISVAVGSRQRVIFQKFSVTLNIYPERYASGDVVKWVAAITGNIDYDLLRGLTELNRDQVLAIDFFKQLLRDVIRNHDIERVGKGCNSFLQVPLFV